MSTQTKTRLGISATALMALVLLFAAFFSVWPSSPAAASGGGGAGNPCDNANSGGPSAEPQEDDCPDNEKDKPNCEDKSKEEGPPSTSDPGNCDSSGTGSFSAYSGNERRVVSDLKVFGSVGSSPLEFRRYGNSRTSAVSVNRGPFGKESAWSHNYLYWMRDSSAAGVTEPMVRIAYPNGADVLYTRSASNHTLWLPAEDQSGRMVQTGDDFQVQYPTGERLNFKRYTNSSGGKYYRIESIDDAHDNRTTFTYNNASDTTVRKVTDASGRWLEFGYNNLGPFLQQETVLGSSPYVEGSGVYYTNWQTINVTHTGSFRWLAVFNVNDYHNAPPLPIAELQFYDENDDLITGTPFYSTPHVSGRDGAKAFDSNSNTYSQYQHMRNGYLGIDCGTPRRVSKIRFLVAQEAVNFLDAGLNWYHILSQVNFVGLNNAQTANHVISSVTSSDGRVVQYLYNVFQDSSGWFKWATLTNVSYPDGTMASYGYNQIHAYTQPVLSSAIDPRVKGRFTNVTWTYSPSTVLGFVKEERSGVTGELIAASDFLSAHQPLYLYPNGRTVQMKYGDAGKLTRRTNGLGGQRHYTYSNGGTGFVDSVKDELGRITTWQRDADARPTLTTHPDGTTEVFTYNSRGSVLTHTITSGTEVRTTAHQYDANNRRIRTDYPDGSYETWTFNSFGQPLTHRLRNTGVQSWTYSATGLKLSHIAADGEETTYAYDSLDRLASMTDTAGRTTSYVYNDRGQLTQTTHPDNTVSSHQYDDFGNLIANTDEAGHTTTYTWNEFRQRTSITDALGRVTTFAYAPSAGGAGSPCGGCNTAGKPTLITLPSGRKIFHQYDAEWNLISTTVGFGSADAATTSYRYNAAFNVDRITDPLGRFSYFTYDSRDRLASVKDIRVLTTSFTYNGFGNKLTETAPGNRVTTYTYDSMDRMLSVTNPLGQTTTFGYDVGGNRILTQLPSGRQTTTAYDLRNRIAQQTIGAGTAEAATTLYSYDDVGNLASEIDPLGRTIVYTHDLRDRVLTVTDPLGRVTQYGYAADGMKTSTQFPDGTLETRVYDSAHQLTAVTDAKNQTVQYAYDLDGRMTALTDARGNTRTWAYDQVGRLLSKTYPDATGESYSYRADGSVNTRTTASGSVESYTYNAKGQLTLRDWSNATPDVSYTYDSTGRLTSLTSADAIVAWTYDVLDRKTSEKQTVQAIGTMKTVSYTYDEDGRVIGITYPGSSKRNYTWTTRGQLAGVTLGTTFNPVATYAYNLAGEQTSLSRSNNFITTTTRDLAGQVTGITHTRNGNPIDSLGYTLDNMGRRTGITRPGGKVDGYTYDPIGQVTAASYAALPGGPGDETFAYDAAGNRVTYGASGVPPLPSTSYITNALDQYTSINGTAQGYDMEGNQLAMQLSPAHAIVSMGWDSENRMTSTQNDASTGAARIDNRYDPLHRRVLKLVSAWNATTGTWDLQSTTRFTYDG